jgi:phage tail-like protein
MADPDRTVPYGAFNFIVHIASTEPAGGFSDVSGLNTEMVVAEYRSGSSAENHVAKVPGLHKVGDVTLKRGIVNSADLWGWISAVRTTGPKAKKDVTITLRDETGKDVQTWTLRRAMPLKYTGPTFAGKASGDVAMEELVLSSEGLDFEVNP